MQQITTGDWNRYGGILPWTYKVLIPTATKLLLCCCNSYIRYLNNMMLLLSYLCLRFGYCEVTDMANSPFWSKTPLKEDNVEQRLLFGLYWALCMINFAGMHVSLIFCT